MKEEYISCIHGLSYYSSLHIHKSNSPKYLFISSYLYEYFPPNIVLCTTHNTDDSILLKDLCLVFPIV